jgi:hypothetical protein
MCLDALLSSFKIQFPLFQKELRKTTTNLSGDSRYPRWGQIRAPSEYKSEVPEPTYPVSDYVWIFFFLLLPLLEHRADLSVSWSFTHGRTPWTGDQLVTRPLPKHRTTQTQKNAHTHQTSMPWVGFEPMIPASEREKSVHASDRSATVTDTTYE